MHFVRKNVILRRLRALGKFRRRCRRPRRRHHHHHHHHHYTTTATVIIMVTNVHAFYAYCLWATLPYFPSSIAFTHPYNRSLFRLGD